MMVSKIEKIFLFLSCLIFFIPQGGYATALENLEMQKVNNLNMLQKDFYEWQTAVLKAHGHLVKVDEVETSLEEPIAFPINMTVIESLYNMTTPPAYISDFSHLEASEPHIRDWIEKADHGISLLRYSGVSFSASGLLEKYEALKEKMLQAIEIE